MIAVTREMGFAKPIADRVNYLDEGDIVEENKLNNFSTTSSKSEPGCFSVRYCDTTNR